MTRDWKKDLTKFESFLRSIDMQKYENLRKIKTVEQDLPKNLLPLYYHLKYITSTIGILLTLRIMTRFSKSIGMKNGSICMSL